MTNTSAGFTFAVGTASKTTGALTITSSAGNNVIAGGAGDDILDFGVTAVDANDTIALGAGSDEVKITAIGSNATTPTDNVFDDAALGWETLTIIENGTTAAMDSRVSLDLSGSADSTARTINASNLTTAGALFTLELGTASKVTGILTVTGGANADTITTGGGADIITAGDGADTLVGGAANDTFVITALSDLTDGSNAVEDGIDGGAGSGDTIAFNGGVTLAAADDFTSKVSNVESLSSNGAQATAIAINTHATFVSDTSIVIIDLSDDTNVLGANVINIAAQSTTTAMTLRGSAGQDTITLDAGSVDTVNCIGDIGSAVTFAAADIITGFVSGTDKLKFVLGDVDGSGSNDNYVEVANADYDTFAAVLTAGNGALATLAGASSSTKLIAVVSDATDADAGEVALGAHVFLDNDGDGTADEVFIFAALDASSIAVGDFIA
jgi:Ca2+-binding RTX toxin-like protein